MRPLRTALADALHLKELRDLGHHRRRTTDFRRGSADRGSADRGSADCTRNGAPSAEQRTGVRPHGERPAPERFPVSEHFPLSEYRRPPEHVPLSEYRRPPEHPGREPHRPSGAEEDPLFVFLREMHHFLTAPQSAATAGGTEPRTDGAASRARAPEPDPGT